MGLKNYLKKSTTVREELINYRLFFELKKAAACRQYHLKIFEANVDFEGFDIVMDDNRLLKQIQIKTKVDAQTNSWGIHKRMLLPNEYIWQDLGFTTGLGIREDRGVILIDVDISDDDIRLNYYYTDVNIIRAIELGLFSATRKAKQCASDVLHKLRYGQEKLSDTFSIPQSLFLKIKGAEEVLAIAGFHTNYNAINVSYQLLQISKIISNPEKEYNSLAEKIPDMKFYWDSAQEQIKKLIAEDSAITFYPLTDDYFQKRSTTLNKKKIQALIQKKKIAKLKANLVGKKVRMTSTIKTKAVKRKISR